MSFGRLTVTSLSSVRQGRSYMWDCVCECGENTVVRGGHLRAGKIRSCGCFQAESRHTHTRTHGGVGTPEYGSWERMRGRCRDPKNNQFQNYGGRGIEVCKRWVNSFENFLADMGKKPSRAHSIDRIDNDGNYEPSNCRWADPVTQASNKRNTKLLTFLGESKTARQWERDLGIHKGRIQSRLCMGWEIEKAISHPPRITRRTFL